MDKSGRPDGLGEGAVSMIPLDRTWSLKPLRLHVRTLGPEDAHLSRIIDSIDRYVAIFRYHLFLARDAMKTVVVADDMHHNLEFIFGSSKQQEEYAQAKIESEANILGCIHSVRALFDVFAFALNGLLLRSRISARKSNIQIVTGALSESLLKANLQQLLISPWFRYVSAFVNTAKHRQLVPHGFFISFETGVANIRLDSFECEGDVFPACTADELLQGILEVKNAIVDCGAQLNDLVLRADD